jgi:predicted ester cyclase
MFSDRSVYIDFPLEIVSNGREEIRAYMSDWLGCSPDIVMQLTNKVSRGDHAGVEWTFTGTHAGELVGISPTGRTFTLYGASFLTLDGRAITACRDYWDLEALRRELLGRARPSTR